MTKQLAGWAALLRRRIRDGKDEILDAEDAAALLQMSPEKVQQWADARLLPSSRLHPPVFSKHELLDWVRRHGPVRGPYEAEGRPPTLQPSFCLYLDILGVQALTSGTNAQQHLEGIAQATDAAARGGLEDRDLGHSTKWFSDNLVVGHPLRERDTEAELGWIFIQAIALQAQLTLAGYFVRGAITLGPLYMDSRHVFGQALVDAYHLETSDAIYPRIILSEAVAAEAKAHLAYYGAPEYSPQNSELLVDEDGATFVNYLSSVLESQEESSILAALSEHRELVSERLGQHSRDTRIMQKYQWVARYHNAFCSQLGEAYESQRVSGVAEFSPFAGS